MANEFLLALNDQGTWEKYDDTYDITIHFENAEERDSFIKWLKSTKGINKVSEEIYTQEYLARKQSESELYSLRKKVDDLKTEITRYAQSMDWVSGYDVIALINKYMGDK